MRRRALERGLAGLALAWLAAVALLAVAGTLTPAEVAASPDRLAAGAAWRLLSSALIADDGVPLLQVALLAAVTGLVLVRHGAVVWWLAALAGHVGSTLIAYALIGVAAALGSASAERVAGEWDYGISCVLAAQLGVLCTGAVRRGPDRSAVDVALAAACALAVPVWLATIDWYGVEHLLAFAIGAGVQSAAARR